MKLYAVLVLMVTLSAASGLRCYQCDAETPCRIINCLPDADRCSTVKVNGVMIKNCFASNGCNPLIDCCEGDLCNSAISTGSSVLLLLMSSAIITVFL